MSELDDIASATTLTAVPQLEEEKSTEQKEEEQKQEAEEFALAALSQHPGWKKIRKMMQTDIEEITMLKTVNMKQYTNEELGEVVRAEHMVAQKLREYLHKIDEAVRAVENGRPRT